MSSCPFQWGRERPGLAGGIDRDGRRAVELLVAGFGSVEFGTVTPEPEPGRQPGVAALVQRLAALSPQLSREQNRTLIGIGIGLSLGVAPKALATHWLAGLQAAWPVADYLSFNLSAAAYRPLLAPQHTAVLAAPAALAGSTKTPSLDASNLYAERISSSVTESISPPDSSRAASACFQLAGLPIFIAVAIVFGSFTG